MSIPVDLLPRTHRRLDFWTHILQSAVTAGHSYVGGCLACWQVVSHTEPYRRCRHCGGRMSWGHAHRPETHGHCSGCGRYFRSIQAAPPATCPKCHHAVTWSFPRPIPVELPPEEEHHAV